MRRRHRTLMRIAGLLAMAGLAAGCKLPVPGSWALGQVEEGGPVASPPAGSGKSNAGSSPGGLGQADPDATKPDATKPDATSQDRTEAEGAKLIGDGAAMLAGTVVRPEARLVSNNSASLTDVGAGVFLADAGGRADYRARSTQGLDQAPESGALVTLESPDRRLLLDREYRTDAQGRFEIPLPKGLVGTVIVHARFDLSGVTYQLSAVATLPETGRATADVDVATTLVTAKVRADDLQGELPGKIDLQKLRTLADLVRPRLGAETLPNMASGSLDILGAFDQLVLDDPEIRAAAAAAHARMAQAAGVGVVSTVYDSQDLVKLMVHRPEETAFTGAGIFEVDRAGNLYFPRFSATTSVPIEIVQVTQGGATASFAVLPPGYLNPVLQAFSGDTYYVAAASFADREVHVFRKDAEGMTPLGRLFRLPPALSRFLGGRLAVDADGNVACAVPAVPAVFFKPSGEDGRVLAGNPLERGYQNGRGTVARFERPKSALFGPDGAIYVADETNRCIRRVTREGDVSTVAGAPDNVPYRNGRGSFARFGTLDSLAAAGRTVFITDTESRRIRRISPSGLTFLVAGTGEPGIENGPGPEARLNLPDFLTLDGAGNVYFLDRRLDPGREYQVIRKIKS